jgi:hypothetical protein
MTVWGTYGNVGNGKDTWGADLIDTWAHMKEITVLEGGKPKKYKLERGLPVYGNLDVFNDVMTADVGRTYKPYRRITVDEFLTLDAHKDLEKCGVPADDMKTHALIYIQEPHAWGIDSRTGNSIISREMSKKGTQSRHYRLDVQFGTQIPTEIDKRFRHLCKVTVLALEPIENQWGDLVQFRYAYFGRYQHKLLTIKRARADYLWTIFDSEQHVDVEFSDEFLADLEANDDITSALDAMKARKKKAELPVQVVDGVRVYSN